MKKIVLIGHGYVGKYIHAQLKSQGISHEWKSHGDYLGVPDLIINATGFTGVPNVDACRLRPQDTINGNVLFPLELERRYDCSIIHITSGCVYTGYKPGGWLETDEPNFNFNNGSFYSASKTLFQQLWDKNYGTKSYLLRIRMPFGPDNLDKNLLMKYQKYQTLVDFENSISNLEDVARCVAHFVEARPQTGIYNAVNPGGVKTHQIAQMLGLIKPWYTHEEFSQAVVEPRSNCVLNSDKMQAEFAFRPATEALIDAIDKIRQIPL